MTAGSIEVPTALRGHDLAIVDVEGNGHNPPEIIEIAVLAVSESTANVDDLRSWLIRPQQPITAIVTRKVHHITNNDVADCPSWPDIACQVDAALAGRVLVAHNARVEQRVLAAHLPYWQPPLVLDTLRLAKTVWPDLPGYGLDKLIAHARIGTEAVAGNGYHRAGYDAWAAFELLCVLIDDADLDWEHLLAAAALPEFLSASEPEGGLW
ncbi:3'-5' exonuclease [Nocardia xishanensis]|uniref:3'-5' exonuclease n=1 Tax=Nocardia xishanensis TaxID=238964 RepID=UPI0033C6A7AD